MPPKRLPSGAATRKTPWCSWAPLPLCITVDFQTIGDGEIEADNCVTIRDRDTMEQVRIPISELKEYIAKKCEF